ncbi:MAG: fibronectin type III domain-containing protein [Methanomassiliicoccales archaeon]|nr:fibronectin type III domain-containing protein [Methanomassiliicoccales archaeon]
MMRAKNRAFHMIIALAAIALLTFVGTASASCTSASGLTVSITGQVAGLENEVSATVGTSASITSYYTAGEGTYTYYWTYEGDNYSISFELSDDLYEYYVDYSIERYMITDDGEDNAVNFITVDDVVITYIAECMEDLTAQSGLDGAEEAQMVLNFVQESIPYSYDTDTHSMDDYWSFPVETLYEGSGDCEDKSFLYTSILESIGYETALLMYDDHVAVGVNCTGLSGWYYGVDGIRYYYCETTATGWAIGEMPSGYNEANVMVIDGLPTAPIGLDVDSGNGEATLTWEAPLSDGGSDIDYYIIYQDGTEIGNTTDLTFTITGLDNGQMYRFTVAAHNSEGTGTVSDPVTVIPSTISTPDAPTDLAVTAGDGSATITWSAPDDDGGADIDYYIIYVNGAPVVRSYDTSATLTGLTNGVNYTITVAAHNSAGVGDGADAVTVEPTASSEDGSDGMVLLVIGFMASMGILIVAVYLGERRRRRKVQQMKAVPFQSSPQMAQGQNGPTAPVLMPSSDLPTQPAVPPAPQPQAAPGPRFCSQCGSPLEGSASFCNACGNRVR